MIDLILRTRPLSFQWETADPFLFCVHHDDDYPIGNEAMGPQASLSGRDIGQDFAGKDGWRMYHGDVVPGFPHHPHRGFETVTILRKGYIDHSDSLGATARFGPGDVQWLTAGKGIVHSEMFPLLSREQKNPVELFQIWLNLPAADKMADPHFSMLWADKIPTFTSDGVSAMVVAGRIGDVVAPPPPPKSWASRPESDLAIWPLHLDAGARWTLPPARAGTNRTLYLFDGGATIAGRAFTPKTGLSLRPDAPVPIENGAQPSELLMLQGRPIGEPVVAHGPFVMNTQAEIQQAFADYRRTQFGGWPWKQSGPVHGRDPARFARHADGREERA